MADGHLNKCKECTKTDSNKHRVENIEDVRAYDRKRGMLPHRVEARRKYVKTEEGKAAHARNTRKQNAKFPKRRAARVALGNAVRTGRIIPWTVCAIPTCENVPEAHHPDYDQPLDVVWLCKEHHKQAHDLVK